MKGFWNQSASDNAYHSVMTAKIDWNNKEYYLEGKKCVEEFLVPFLNKKGIKDRMSILDLGCGTGRTTIHFLEYFDTVVGTDVSEEMIAVAKNDHADSGIKFLATSGEDLKELDSESFNMVFSFATLQHINTRKGVEKNIEEIYRILKPGGCAKIEVRGAPGDPPGRLLWFRGFNHFYIGLFLWHGIFPILLGRLFTPLYGACFTEKQLRSILLRIGFINIEAYTLGGRHLWAEIQK